MDDWKRPEDRVMPALAKLLAWQGRRLLGGHDVVDLGGEVQAVRDGYYAVLSRADGLESCNRARRAAEEENARLRALVEYAYRHGFGDGQSRGRTGAGPTADHGWSEFSRDLRADLGSDPNAHLACAAGEGEADEVREGAPAELVDRFFSAYDAWANSDELCGGPLFDAMLDARGEAEAVYPWSGDECGPDA